MQFGRLHGACKSCGAPNPAINRTVHFVSSFHILVSVLWPIFDLHLNLWHCLHSKQPIFDFAVVYAIFHTPTTTFQQASKSPAPLQCVATFAFFFYFHFMCSSKVVFIFGYNIIHSTPTAKPPGIALLPSPYLVCLIVPLHVPKERRFSLGETHREPEWVQVDDTPFFFFFAARWIRNGPWRASYCIPGVGILEVPDKPAH